MTPHPVLRWPSNRAEEWVNDFLASAENDHSILAVIAVGSSVRPNVESVDLDLLVVRDAPPRPASAPIEVDVREYQSDTVQQRICEGHDLLGWAVNYGVLLHEKHGYWTSILNQYAGKVPLPSATSAVKRAEKAQIHLENIAAAEDFDAAAEQLITVLTHVARARLINAGVYPQSRPELPGQLRVLGDIHLAEDFEKALSHRAEPDRLRSLLHDSAGYVESLLHSQGRTTGA